MLGSEKQESYVKSDIEIEPLSSSTVPVGNNRTFMGEIELPQMQNDDLAEADQSQLEMELEEQEGAVGGILEERVGSTQVMYRESLKFILY